jgi:hypothetical protein
LERMSPPASVLIYISCSANNFRRKKRNKTVSIHYIRISRFFFLR